jgi:hypothetical protein
MTQELITRLETVVAPAYQTAVDEDVIRQSLIDAIAVIETAKHGADGWFAIIETGQTLLINTQQHLNRELEALLRGEYLKFCADQLAKGRRREERGR